MSEPVEFCALPAELFPLTMQLLRHGGPDDGEVLWETVAESAGVVSIPSFGALGIVVRARITFADGDTIEESLPLS